MDGIQLSTAAFSSGEPPQASARRKRGAASAWSKASAGLPKSHRSADTVQIVFAVENESEMRIIVLMAKDEEWLPVSRKEVEKGFEVLLDRESRLERTALRFGLSAEALLATLEKSAVDLSDRSGGVPDAELTALREAGIILEGSGADPSGAAQVALGQARAQQVHEGALSVADAAELLNLTPGRVRQKIASGDVMAIPGSDPHLLPNWQFVEGRLVAGLRELADVAMAVHPLTLRAFMLRADVDLEIDGLPVSPLRWLATGGDPAVVADLADRLSIPA